MEIGIGVAREGERSQAGGFRVDPELLPEFAQQSGLGRLAGRWLAARKLPQPGHRLALGALRQKHAPVAVHQGGGGDQQHAVQER